MKLILDRYDLTRNGDDLIHEGRIDEINWSHVRDIDALQRASYVCLIHNGMIKEIKSRNNVISLDAHILTDRLFSFLVLERCK